MAWDPSQATASCKRCGCIIEAWLDICDDCVDECLHENTEVMKDLGNGYFQVKCKDCGEVWIDG